MIKTANVIRMTPTATGLAPCPRVGDYLDTLLEDLTYEVIRREGIHVHLTGEEWQREADMLAARLRPLVIDYIARHND